jgi:thiamine-phosphate pyrophosphorylase
MLPKVTAAVSRAMELARALARDQGLTTLLPIHLWHGLLAEEEGRAGVLATTGGLNWSAYRRAGPTAPDVRPTDDAVELGPSARAAFSLARERSLELAGESEVSGEVLLLALLQTDEALRRDAEALGLRLARVEEELRSRRLPPIQLDEPLNLGQPTERVDLARVLDACANRAREGLRVAEDYCRFVLDDRFLCGELKGLRHNLTGILAEFAGDLLSARDTSGDVGTDISTDAEQHRHTLVSVAQAAMKRLQEALRSLEEFGKMRGPEVGRRLEALRYRCYTLEKAIVGGTEARRRLDGARLYVLLTGSSCKASLEWTVAEAAAGGADVIQMREKGLSERDLLARARDMRRWTRRAGVLFIVNDRPDIARLVDAEGVHLGQEDLPVREARRLLGPDAVIGVSTHSMDQLRKAVLDGAGYVGVGPAFPSGTKPSFPESSLACSGELPGLDFVRAATAETTLPAFVIGGVNLKMVGEAVAAGARRVAVSQAVAAADDPHAVAAAIRRALP